MIKKAIIGLIGFYHKCLSSLKLPCCCFYPTCSQYTKEAVIKHGPLKGILKGAFRVLRCHPFSKGGYDPVD